MWILPSYARPLRCEFLINAMIEHKSYARGVVFVNEDDPFIDDYNRISLPIGWKIIKVDAGCVGAAEAQRKAFRLYPNEKWYGSINDDMLIKTVGFEQELVNEAGNWGIASSNDTWQAKEDIDKGRMHGVVVFGGDLVRALGGIAPEGFKHLYVDDVWETIGRELCNWRVLMHVITPHVHSMSDSTTARVNSSEINAHDKKVFDEWISKDAPMAIWNARKKMWESMGLKLCNAARRSVLFGFPVYERPHPDHMASAMDTSCLFGQLGIQCGHVQVVGKPIHQARNTIAHKFMKSSFTDLMMIDSDMSWNPWDAVKFVVADHPLLAGIGRKRNDRPDEDPTAWCFSPFSDGVIECDSAGMAKVAQVGTGFMRIRREVFETLSPHVMSMQCDPEGKEVYSRYFSWDEDGRFELSEDISFCRRWRNAGGDVWVDPSVRLSHYGDHKHISNPMKIFHRS